MHEWLCERGADCFPQDQSAACLTHGRECPVTLTAARHVALKSGEWGHEDIALELPFERPSRHHCVIMSVSVVTMTYNIFACKCPFSIVVCPGAALSTSSSASSSPWWTSAEPGESLDDYLRSLGASLWPANPEKGQWVDLRLE
eukprot:6491371-Amphidinium_carterae.2